MAVFLLKENMEDKDQTRDEKGHTPRIIVGEKRNTNARYELNDFDLVLIFAYNCQWN